MTRIEPAKVEAMIEASKEDLAAAASQPAGNGELVKEPIAAEIDFDAFAAVDLRIALIEKCEFVEAPTSCCACRWTSATRSVTCSPGSRARIPTRAPWKAA